MKKGKAKGEDGIVIEMIEALNTELQHYKCQLGKALLRAIMNRLGGKINGRVSEEQFGFRKGKGAANAIFAI